MTISRMPCDTASVVSSVYANLKVRWKASLELRHLFADALDDAERVGSGRLEDCNRAAWLPVDPADLLVVEGAELDPRDVPQPDDRAVRIRPHGNGAELLFRLKATLRADRVGHLLTGRSGVRADLT